MNKKYILAIILCILIILLAGLFLLPHSVAKQPESTQIELENQAADLAATYVVQNKLTTLPENCFSEDIISTTTDIINIDIREVHNAMCGGDPQTAPRIASVSVNTHTNVVTKQN